MVKTGQLQDAVIQLSATDIHECIRRNQPIWVVVLRGGHCIAGGMKTKFASKHMDLSHVVKDYKIDLSDYIEMDPWVPEFFDNF